MNRINIIITGDELAEKLQGHLQAHELKFLRISKCRGYSNKFNFWEFVGAAETKKTMLMFSAGKLKSNAISRFILKYYDQKNNGIMFAIDQECEMKESVLYVFIVDMGKSEKVADVIRKTAGSGATVIDARGSGENAEEFFGTPIGSGKEIVLSAIAHKHLDGVKKAIKTAFMDETSDVVSFVIPITDFNKLHQER
ncbi:MAG: hypothetical protein IJ959_01805 [Clostridia bacterium]|nr:hypothetical protein [Clostridia bacterium]MBR2220957.1 hypothetical protein [Clostridia bacterium]